MPAKSQAQRGYLASKFGPEWARKHHFNNKGPLPERVQKHQQGSSNLGLKLFKQAQRKR